MKKILAGAFLITLTAFLASVNVFAYDGSRLVDADTYAELRSKGNIQKSYYKQKNVKLSLVPDTQLSKDAAKFWNKADEPSFIVENLYLMPKSKVGSGDPSKTTIEYASKVMRSVSKMKGMQYYSSDKKWETLYKDAYCIAGPKDRTRVPDDTEGSADGKVIYCLQDDNSFGKTNYRLEYHQTAQEVSAGFSNTTPMYLGPIKGVNEDNLRISIVIIDCGQDFMVYMLVQAKFPALKILENSMNESFSSRLDAVYNWFLKQF